MRRVTSLAAALLVVSLFLPAGSSAADKAKLAANAVVKSVSATSLTVTASDGKDMTFSIDTKTKVTGKGIGTAAAKKGKGGRAAINDLLSAGDVVSVNYHDMSGTLHAASVERSKAAATR